MSLILLVNKCLFKAVCYLSGDAQFVQTSDSSLQTVGGGQIKWHHLAMATKTQPQLAMEMACRRLLMRQDPSVCHFLNSAALLKGGQTTLLRLDFVH